MRCCERPATFRTAGESSGNDERCAHAPLPRLRRARYAVALLARGFGAAYPLPGSGCTAGDVTPRFTKVIRGKVVVESKGQRHQVGKSSRFARLGSVTEREVQMWCGDPRAARKGERLTAFHRDARRDTSAPLLQVEQTSRLACAVLDANQIAILRQRVLGGSRLAATVHAAPAVVIGEAIDHGHHSPASRGNERRALGGVMRAAWTSPGIAAYEVWVDTDEIEREGRRVVVTERAVRALNHEPHLLLRKRQREARGVRRRGQTRGIELCVTVARHANRASRTEQAQVRCRQGALV